MFCALIQLIIKPKNHEKMLEVLLQLKEDNQKYPNNDGFNIHYLISNPGAYYVLSRWRTKTDMTIYLRDFNDYLVDYLSPYLVSQPTISRAKMLSRPSNKIIDNVSNEQITLIPFFYIIPSDDEIEKVKEAHLSVIQSTRNEPGCLTYDLYQSIDDPAIMFFYENWSSSDVLLTHMNTPTFYEVVRGEVDPYLLVPWTALSMKMVK